VWRWIGVGPFSKAAPSDAWNARCGSAGFHTGFGLYADDRIRQSGTLFTGHGGKAWADAAEKLADDLSVEIEAHVIGPRQEDIDHVGDWARAREAGVQAASSPAQINTCAGDMMDGRAIPKPRCAVSFRKSWPGERATPKASKG